jgi:hypothetical protein
MAFERKYSTIPRRELGLGAGLKYPIDHHAMEVHVRL